MVRDSTDWEGARRELLDDYGVPMAAPVDSFAAAAAAAAAASAGGCYSAPELAVERGSWPLVAGAPAVPPPPALTCPSPYSPPRLGHGGELRDSAHGASSSARGGRQPWLPPRGRDEGLAAATRRLGFDAEPLGSAFAAPPSPSQAVASGVEGGLSPLGAGARSSSFLRLNSFLLKTHVTSLISALAEDGWLEMWEKDQLCHRAREDLSSWAAGFLRIYMRFLETQDVHSFVASLRSQML